MTEQRECPVAAAGGGDLKLPLHFLELLLSNSLHLLGWCLLSCAERSLCRVLSIKVNLIVDRTPWEGGTGSRRGSFLSGAESLCREPVGGKGVGAQGPATISRLAG